ncbi:MAG: flippase-like domain-containing protein [Saprospiraceae bacterium]|nr:flippase-like domain-containing protein [Saprospiraceae bacterium]
MKKLLGNLLRSLLFLGVGLGILGLLYRSQQKAYAEECALKGIPEESCSLLDKVISDFASANYGWIGLVLVIFTISNVSRTMKWIMLIKPLGHQVRFINAFFSIAIGYFANLGLPRLGEVIRAGTLSRYERIGAEKVMGTIVVDRIIDVISILTVTGLAVILEYDTMLAFFSENTGLAEKTDGLGNLLLFLLPIGGLVVVLLFVFRKQLEKVALFRKIKSIVVGFLEGLRTISQLDKPWLFVLHSINIWLMYYLMTYVCFFAFAPTSQLTPLVALIVFTFGSWGIVVPSPGGMGTYHYLVQTALAMYGVPGEDGFSFANIAFFSIQLGVNVFLGILALVLIPRLNRNYKPKPSKIE